MQERRREGPETEDGQRAPGPGDRPPDSEPLNGPEPAAMEALIGPGVPPEVPGHCPELTPVQWIEEAPCGRGPDPFMNQVVRELYVAMAILLRQSSFDPASQQYRFDVQTLSLSLSALNPSLQRRMRAEMTGL